MWGCLKFAYKALNQTVPSRITLNQTTTSQTKPHIAKFSCVGKRENRAWLNFTDTILSLSLSPPPLSLSFDFAHHLIFLKEHDILEADSLSAVSHRST